MTLATPPLRRTRAVEGDALAGLAGQWEDARCAVGRPQMGHRLELLLDPAVTARGPDAAVGAVVVEDGDRLVGFAPWRQVSTSQTWDLRMARARRPVASWRLRVVEVVGETFAAPATPELAEALYRGVRATGRRADAIRFRRVADDTALAQVLGAGHALSHRGWLRFRDPVPAFRWHAPLGGRLDEYLARQMGGRKRRELTREVRRLAAAPGGTTLDVVTEARDVGWFLEQAHRVDDRSWHQGRSARGLGRGPETAARLEALAGAGVLRCYVLSVGGEPVAHVLAYASDCCLLLAKMAFDTTWARLSPGKVLLWHVLDDLHRAGGFTHIDMGPGDWWFKQAFAGAGYPVRDTTLVRLRPRAVVALGPSLVWRSLRARIDRALAGRPAAERARTWARRHLAR